MVEASVTSTSDPFHSYAGKTEEEEVKRSGEDEEEAMKSGADREKNTSLLWKSKGFTYEFAKSPARHVVWILLVLRAVERGVYFGYMFLSLGFLTGEHYSLIMLKCSENTLHIETSLFHAPGEYNNDWYPGEFLILMISLENYDCYCY